MAADNILPSSVNDVDGSYTVVLFPNPVRGTALNVVVSGTDLSQGNYTITDVAGRVVKTGNLNAVQGNLKFELDESVPNGNYYLNIVNGKNVKIATEQFSVSR
jgi:flagellar hook assembly protein FlgD